FAELREPGSTLGAIAIDHDGDRRAPADLCLLDREEHLARVPGHRLAAGVHARQHVALDLPVLDLAAEPLREQPAHQHAHGAARAFALLGRAHVERSFADQQQPHASASASRRSSPTLNHISPTLKPDARRSLTPGSEISGRTTVSPLSLRPKTSTSSGGTKS